MCPNSAALACFISSVEDIPFYRIDSLFEAVSVKRNFYQSFDKIERRSIFYSVNTMSGIDSEINSLRARIVLLEQQKRFEDMIASEKKAFPLKTLQKIVDDTRNGIPKCQVSSPSFYPQMYERMKLEFLEPILDALKNIQERLDILEQAHVQKIEPSSSS